jgi:hypothetical protein
VKPQDVINIVKAVHDVESERASKTSPYYGWEPEEPTTREIQLGNKRFLVSCVSLKDNVTTIEEVKKQDDGET